MRNKGQNIQELKVKDKFIKGYKEYLNPVVSKNL